MPKGIISQFIVVMHEYIAHNYQWVWKSGVVLEKDNALAEIIEYYGKREIHIRVHGKNKKELLNIVSYELDKINGSYERLKDKCKKLIPCNCDVCCNSQEPHFHDYRELKERLSNRKYTIECRNPPYTDIDILKLIDDIDLSGMNTETRKNYQPQQNIQITVNANQENDVSENRNINTNGGAYTEGNVNLNNGDFVGRDKVTNNQGISKEEFLQLLQTFKQDLSNSGLPEDTVESVSDDIKAVEKQLQKDEPNTSIISGLLEDANKTMDTVAQGQETFNKILETGKTLLSVFSFLAL